MSINRENTNANDLVSFDDSSSDAEGITCDICGSVFPEEEFSSHYVNHHGLRAVANSRWVIVPKGFVPPEDPHKCPVELVPISFDFGENNSVTFLVVASIVDDPELYKKLLEKICEEYSDLFPGGTFDKMDLRDFRSIDIYTVDEMEQEIEKMEDCSYLLQGLIPRQSVNIMVGDSGIGKSPFCYELGMCIAAGLPFLGIPTTQGRVLYLDYEDDIALMISYARTISRKLGLPDIPDTFRLWSPAMSNIPDIDPFKLIYEFHPDFVIIDTLSTAFPLAETENHIATDLYKQFRKIGVAVLFTHHLVKESTSGEDVVFDLDLNRETTVRDFQSVRGAGALVNTAYLRLKLIRSRSSDEDFAFIVRSYRRGKGGLPTLSIGREFDDNGEPIGHQRLGGLARIQKDYQNVFKALPERFRWKDLAEHFKGNGSKQVFIRACESAKILKPKKDGDYYVKLPGWNNP